MDNLKDEKTLLAMAISLILGYSALALFNVPAVLLHELLHHVGASLLSGTVKNVVLFNPQAWISNFVFPFGISTFGYVEASFPTGTNLFLYYMLPYLVLFSFSAIFVVLSVVDDDYDPLLLIAGPFIYFQYIYFWTDYSLMMGMEKTVTAPLFLNVMVFLTCLSMTSYEAFTIIRRELI